MDGIQVWIREGIELLSVLAGLWWHSSSVKRRQEEMHRANDQRLAIIEDRVNLIYKWMQTVVFGMRSK